MQLSSARFSGIYAFYPVDIQLNVRKKKKACTPLTPKEYSLFYFFHNSTDLTKFLLTVLFQARRKSFHYLIVILLHFHLRYRKFILSNLSLCSKINKWTNKRFENSRQISSNIFIETESLIKKRIIVIVIRPWKTQRVEKEKKKKKEKNKT